MAGLSIRKDLAEKIDDSSQPNTFAGNAMISAACMANIDILTENDSALIKRAAELGEEIKQQLVEGAEDIRVIGDVRGKGLMIGIELVEDKESRKPLNGDHVVEIVMGMLNSGLVMVPCGRFGNVLRFMPPLVLTREHGKKAVDILLETSKKV